MRTIPFLVAAAALWVVGGAPAAEPVGSNTPQGGAAAVPDGRGPAWVRHAIDASSKGADGVRLADVNGDGLPDIATAWEEGGVVRAYLHPGRARVKEPWPAVTLATRGAGEDAVFADLDGDGAADLVSCHEGGVRSVFVHWGPRDKASLLDPAAWRTEVVPALARKQMWMFALPLEGGVVLGSKDKAAATIGMLARPGNGDPRDLSKWTWAPWYEAGWVMSLLAVDMDGDGDPDVLASDRYLKNAGVVWFENPGPSRPGAAGAGGAWKTHRVVGRDVIGEPRFLAAGDVDRDGKPDIVVASPGDLAWLTAAGAVRKRLAMPAWSGRGKAVSIGDVDGDGLNDIVFSCENAGLGTNRAKQKGAETAGAATSASAGRSGVGYFSRKGQADGAWAPHDISGPEGIKYDLVPLADLDGDGDLDVLTTEEREGGKGLGVVWYENPAK